MEAEMDIQNSKIRKERKQAGLPSPLIAGIKGGLLYLAILALIQILVSIGR
jgi:hypothetical protein